MSSNPFDQYDNLQVKADLSKKILAVSSKTLNPNTFKLSLKYGVIFIGSIFLSLALCPQRGVGFFPGSTSFVHHLLHQSELLCGAYCGLVFFLTTHLLTFLLLSHFERLKIIRKVSFVPLLFMSGFFGLTMTSLFSKLALGTFYNLSWISVVTLSYFGVNYFYSKRIELS